MPGLKTRALLTKGRFRGCKTPSDSFIFLSWALVFIPSENRATFAALNYKGSSDPAAISLKEKINKNKLKLDGNLFSPLFNLRSPESRLVSVQLQPRLNVTFLHSGSPALILLARIKCVPGLVSPPSTKQPGVGLFLKQSVEKYS